MVTNEQPQKAHASMMSMLLEDASRTPIVLITIASVVFILVVFGLSGLL